MVRLLGQIKQGPSRQRPPPVPAPHVVNKASEQGEKRYWSKGSNLAAMARSSVLRTGRPRRPPISSSAHPQRILRRTLLTFGCSPLSTARLSLARSCLSSGQNTSSLQDKMHSISCRVSVSCTKSLRVDKVVSQLYVAPHKGILAGTQLVVYLDYDK